MQDLCHQRRWDGKNQPPETGSLGEGIRRLCDQGICFSGLGGFGCWGVGADGSDLISEYTSRLRIEGLGFRVVYGASGLSSGF